MNEEFLEKLKETEKNYFTLKDFEKIWPGKKESLKVVVSRLVKAGQLKRIQRNYYFLPEKIFEIEEIANQIYFPSYLSFESALSRWGILSQIPYVLSFATSLKTKKIAIEKTKIEYRKIKKELFFGFSSQKGIYIAFPEKALLDTFYLASFGKLKINFEKLDYSKIQKKKLFLWLKKFPSKTQKLALKFLK